MTTSSFMPPTFPQRATRPCGRVAKLRAAPLRRQSPRQRRLVAVQASSQRRQGLVASRRHGRVAASRVVQTAAAESPTTFRPRRQIVFPPRVASTNGSQCH